MVNVHKPVLLQEVIKYLSVGKDKKFVDGTLGGGGYSEELLKRGAEVLAIDLDKAAIENFKKEKSQIAESDNLILIQGNFAEVKKICYERTFTNIDGIVLDLGLSSNQLEDQERGFSFQNQGFLDMRFDSENNDLTAFEIINKYSQRQLSEIFAKLGEEVLAGPISKKITEMRRQKEISSPGQLASIVEGIYSKYFKRPSRMPPATKVFQALRMEVNNELDNLKSFLPQAVELLKPEGRLAIVSFHSLEDREVKNFFRQESKDCICPKEVPICQCDHKASLKILTKKPLTAGEKEIKENPRARSAKLRVAEKL